MEKYTWLEAVTKVLEEEKRALHYTDIARLIFERNYKPAGSGATPDMTVSKELTINPSLFAKVNRGEYILRKYLNENENQEAELTKNKTTSNKGNNFLVTPSEGSKVINAFGIYWNRNFVSWKSSPDFWGVQQIGAKDVNFKDQIGIYLLHDNRETIYVGQAIDQTLGQRIKQHTSDRLSGRWDRFSWFGLYPVNDTGTLEINRSDKNYSIQALGDILEAVLIESLEPRQNRKQGNLFYGLEYLQVEDPEIKKKKKEQLLRELTDKL